MENRRKFGDIVDISANISFIYWYSSHPSIAAEALECSFIYLDDDSNYELFARSFTKYGVALTIDGLELENDDAIYSEPQKLNENYTANSLIILLRRVIMVLKDSCIIYGVNDNQKNIEFFELLINEYFIFIFSLTIEDVTIF